MDEKHLKQILKIEGDCQSAYEQAVHEADLLPMQAEAEVKALLLKTKEEAEAEAKKIIESSNDLNTINAIITENDMEIKKMLDLATANHAHAVDFVIQELLGK